MSAPLISAPGAYPDISAEDYHRVEICDAPSISSTGLKLIEAKSARHYWHQSPLNPNRPEQPQKRHFNVGKAVHDRILLEDLFPKEYFITPEGFDARYKKWADAKEERDAAIEAGTPVISHADFQMVEAIAEEVARNELAQLLLKSGKPEMTLAAKDPHTGVWMRARPDLLPDTTEIIPDIKTTMSAHPDAFEQQATKLGYFQSAAFYLDVVNAIYGEVRQKRRFLLVAVEKEPPYPVEIFQLDDEALQNGRMLNRKALNLFAECLRRNEWPGYGGFARPEIRSLTMTRWAHADINRRVDDGELSFED